MALTIPYRRRAASVPAAIATAPLQTPLGTLHLYSGPRGVLAVVLPDGSPAAAEARLRRLLGPVAIREDASALAVALAQLADYFSGRRRLFDLALDPRGTPFQRLVWEAVARVPYGETRTYGALADEIGRPAAARAVGLANGANPLPLLIPCHRIVGADGSLTGYRGGLAAKRWLLALERGQPALV